ncbi:MAG: deoxyguanosinetriphosphate triphosphohydrolase [Cucumibacter sp.]
MAQRNIRSGESPLAHYASDPARSRGRLYPVSASPTRSDYQRDRDRIIHSSAFRRLQYKTQVFLKHEGSHFRTRLTHSLEVSQIARSIARALRLNEDLAEALALAHDLGHTPFGHAGERVLDARMRDRGGFDHNMQAIRVVTRIENRYATHDGLNLTWETLEGIVKHNGPLTDKDGHPAGRYAETGLPFGLNDKIAPADLMLSTYASLEAQAAAIADDIAYNAHDIDDGVRANVMTLDDLFGTPLAMPIVAEVRRAYPRLETARATHETVRRLVTSCIEDVIAHSGAAIAGARLKSADDARHAGRQLITFSPQMALAEQGLKAELFDRVYRHADVMRLVAQAERIVARLFDAYMQGAPMPGRWGEAWGQASPEARPRIVCDFVAGMTDQFALAECQRLFDDKPEFG